MNRAKTPTKLQSSSSRRPTPSRVQGVRSSKNCSDENSKPSGSGSFARTPPSSRTFTRFKTHTSSSAKIHDDASSASSSSESGLKTPTRTPLGSMTRLNVNRSSAKTPPRVTPIRTPNRTPTKSFNYQTEELGRSIVIEFSDDIFVTPRKPPTPGSVSVTSSSVIRIEDSPMHGKSNSSLNRSLSASELYPSDNMRPKMKRSRSEAKLSSDNTSSEAADLVEGETSRLKVGVRVRPLQSREHGNAVAIAGRDISVASDLGSVHIFTFDHCFPSAGTAASSQEDLYETLVRPLVDTAFEGYNACLFAYGQTGSGKTYSMMGPFKDAQGVSSESGIIPRFCEELLARSSAMDDSELPNDKSTVTTSIEISYLEVYNEKIRDLLAPGSNPLKVREHQVYGPYVENLSKHLVQTWNEFQLWLNVGNKKRATAATEMNEQSSRSHSLFTVVLTQTFACSGNDGSWSHDQTRRSQINLVDLAGSERISHFSVTSDRLREGASINRSLLTLGKVISALVDRRGFVPYRESVLTWLLKDSLGGNSRTTMLATVSPCSSHIEETLATLRYASQARSIVNTVRVNEAPQDKIIRELKAEVERLKTIEVKRTQSGGGFPSSLPLSDSEEMLHLKQELFSAKVELEEARRSESELTTEINGLKERLTSLEVDSATKDLKMKEYGEINKGLAAKVEELKSEKTRLTAENLSLNGERLKLQDQLDSAEKNFKKKSEGFEKLEKTATALQDDYNSLKKKNFFLESSNEKLRCKLEENDALIKELEEQIKSSQEQLNASMATFILKEEFCNAQAALELDAKSKQEEVNRLRDELKSNSVRLTMVQKECEDKIASFENNVSSLIKEVELLHHQLNQSREENISIQEKLKETNCLNENLKVNIKDKEDELVKLKKYADDLKSELSKANEKRSRIAEGELKKYKVENEIKQKRICSLEEKLDQTERVLEPLRRLQCSVRILFDEVSDIDETIVLRMKEKLSAYEKKSELCEREIDEMRNTTNELRSQCAQLLLDLTTNKHVMESKEMEWVSSKARLKADVEKLTSENEELAKNKCQLEEKLKHVVEDLTKKLGSMKNEIGETRRLLEISENEKVKTELLLQQEKIKLESFRKELEDVNNKSSLKYDSKQDSAKETNKSLKKKLRAAESEKKELEYDLSVRKINEESMEANLQSKMLQIADLQKELVSSHEWNKKLMEEKLVLVKVMEKQCTENDSNVNQSIVRDNESLKKDLKICEKMLEKKSNKILTLEQKIESLKKKLDNFLDFVTKVVENKIEYEDEKAFIKQSLARKEEETYEFIMNLGFPHHFEVIVRKARTLSEELKIPYDIEIIEGTKSARFKHLTLSAVANLSHYRLNEWVKQVEKNKSWKESFDRELPWEVNFDFEPQPPDNSGIEGVRKHNWEILKVADQSPPESDSTTPPSVYSTDTLNPCPIAWRKTIIKRHLQGIVDDAKVLRQYFQGTEGSRVYSILSRIISGVDRLEEEAEKKRKSFFNCDTYVA